jgi:hypothetical protein
MGRRPVRFQERWQTRHTALQGTPLAAGDQGTVPNELCVARLYRNDLFVGYHYDQLTG